MGRRRGLGVGSVLWCMPWMCVTRVCVCVCCGCLFCLSALGLWVFGCARECIVVLLYELKKYRLKEASIHGCWRTFSGSTVALGPSHSTVLYSHLNSNDPCLHHLQTAVACVTAINYFLIYVYNQLGLLLPKHFFWEESVNFARGQSDYSHQPHASVLLLSVDQSGPEPVEDPSKNVKTTVLISTRGRELQLMTEQTEPQSGTLKETWQCPRKVQPSNRAIKTVFIKEDWITM